MATSVVTPFPRVPPVRRAKPRGNVREDMDYRLDDFELDPAGKRLKPVEITEAITASGMTLAIDQANTFTVEMLDMGRHLLRGNLLSRWVWGTNADERDEAHWVRRGRAVYAEIDGLDLQLVKLAKSEDVLTLTFEESAVVRLRNHEGARKVFRDNGITRAEFVQMLCRAAKVPTHIPELHRKQPVAKPEKTSTDTVKRSEGEKGLDPSADLTVKGKRADKEQRANMEVCSDIANKLRAPELAVLAMHCAAIGESDYRKGASNDIAGGHDGVFQSNQIPGKDLAAQCWHFLKGGRSFLAGGAIRMARANPGMSPGEIATRVEISDANGAFYNAYLGEAKRIMRAYQPGFAGSEYTTTVNKPYAFKRGEHESSWDAIQRLAEEVNWRAFVRRGVLWYVSEAYLFQQKPQLAVRENKDGVEAIDFDVDLGARNLVSEVSITARADRWTVLPGMVCSLRGMGPADGRWIVTQAEKASLTTDDDTVTISCHKPLPVKPEPANETEEVTLEFGSQGKITGGDIRKMSPKAIIDKIVIPVARRNGIHVTVGSVEAANGRHGPTVSGRPSDHQGPPRDRWAADMSNGQSPTPQMDKLAKQLGEIFEMQWHGSGLVDAHHWGFRFQLIYRTNEGGNHYNHVHFGVRKE